jgi:hypothetical protein
MQNFLEFAVYFNISIDILFQKLHFIKFYYSFLYHLLFYTILLITNYHLLKKNI